MNRTTQQQHFSNRLREVMRERSYPIHSPTFLMREFNRHSASAKITVHAARKWLIGEAIPTQEKLLVLSRWLGIAPEWLRFDGDDPNTAPTPPSMSPQAVALGMAFDGLSEPRRRLVVELVQMLGDLEVPKRDSR